MPVQIPKDSWGKVAVSLAPFLLYSLLVLSYQALHPQHTSTCPNTITLACPQMHDVKMVPCWLAAQPSWHFTHRKKRKDHKGCDFLRLFILFYIVYFINSTYASNTKHALWYSWCLFSAQTMWPLQVCLSKTVVFQPSSSALVLMLKLHEIWCRFIVTWYFYWRRSKEKYL